MLPTVAIEALLRVGFRLALVMVAAVVIERAVVAYAARRTRWIEDTYGPAARRALAGDADAAAVLAACPARHRLRLAALLIIPLIDDRDPARIARTRAIVQAMAIVPIADRYLRSWRWWKRAVALRALGLMQMTERTAQIIAAFDDSNADVRAAALDAVTDLRNRASLQAIVVRLTDPSLPPGRCAAALTAFGSAGEPFLIELAALDSPHRAHYIRALALCGTPQSRAALVQWTGDPRPDVQAAALDALAHVGLDEAAAPRVVACLQHPDALVRSHAAFALRGFASRADVVAALAGHLDDDWSVAVRAAQALRSMRPHGLDALRASAGRDGPSGVLARQMLWEEVAAS